MIDVDKYMNLVPSVARTNHERSIWYGLIGEISNLNERVKVLEAERAGAGPATVTKPPTKKVTKKTAPKKGGEG